MRVRASRFRLNADEQIGFLLSFIGTISLNIGILSAEAHGLIFGMGWVGSGLMMLGFGIFILVKHSASMTLFGAGIAVLMIAAALRVSGVA